MAGQIGEGTVVTFKLWHIIVIPMAAVLVILGGVYAIGDRLIGGVEKGVARIDASVEKLANRQGGLEHRVYDLKSDLREKIFATDLNVNEIKGTLTTMSKSVSGVYAAINRMESTLERIDTRLIRVERSARLATGWGSGKIVDPASVESIVATFKKTGFPKGRYLIFPIGADAEKSLEFLKQR